MSDWPMPPGAPTTPPDDENRATPGALEGSPVSAAPGRWEPFTANELRVLVRGLRQVDMHWAENATLGTVKQMRRIRNQRDRMVAEIQAELELRRVESRGPVVVPLPHRLDRVSDA